MKLIDDDNLFTKDSLYADDKAVDENTGAFKAAHILREVDKEKIEVFAKEKNLSGNLKSVTDEIVKSMKDEGSLRKFMIDAGSNKDRGVNNLLSVLPRNLTETQARTFRTQEVLSLSRAAATCGASDDLQSTSALWIKGNFGKGSQSQSDMAYVGYDLTTMGATIGAEFALGETVTVGAAGTYANTKLEYKDLRDGEKDEFSSFLGSVYGNATFSNNFVLNGTFIVGNTNIEGHSLGLSAKSTKADDKLSAMSFGGTMLAGYKFAKETFSITPLGGMSIANFADPERKVANGHATVKGSDLTRIDLVGGLTVAGEMRMSDMVLEPELHGFVYYNLKDEKKQQSIKFEKQELTPMLTNTTKTNFVLGGGLSSKTGMVEYGLTVDGQFADKYWGVLGSLKLKVNL
jgi:outer membrane autotransporter protein